MNVHDAVTPNLFIVGAAKAGTTSLYEMLSRHPEVGMSTIKEPHYFGEYRPPGTFYSKEEDYLALFSQCKGRLVVGEASTAYLYSPSAAGQIKRFNPNAKIVIVLRNPIDRAYSLYLNHVRDGAEYLSFENALAAESDRIGRGWSYGFHMVQSGMYSEQVLRYLRVFGEQSVLILLYEDLRDCPNRVYGLCCEFLGINPSGYPHNIHANKSGLPRYPAVAKVIRSKNIARWVASTLLPARLKRRVLAMIRTWNVKPAPPMRPETRRSLYSVFKSDINALEGVIGRSLEAWR